MDRTCTATLVAAALAASLPALAGTLPARFVARDLGTLGGATAIATGIDAEGRVVGTSERGDGAPAHAFVTGPDGIGMLDLCPAQALSCGATAINASGLVVGNYETELGVLGFTVRRDGSGFATLGPRNIQRRITQPAAVADGGEIAGTEIAGGSVVHAFTAAGPDAPIIDRGSFATGAAGLSYGLGVNAAGTLVGCSLAVGDVLHAFVRPARRHHLADIGTLGGRQSCAWAIDAGGIVVGWADTPVPDASHAFFARAPYAALVDIGTLGGLASRAIAVNDAGHVVGSSEQGSVRYETRAFVYDVRTGRLSNLNALVDLPHGLVLTQAVAINARDQIAANGNDGHAWLLTPAGR